MIISMNLPRKRAIRFVLAVALCQSAGLIGSVFTFSAIPTWYAALNKPFFSPPNSIFGPVWTILFTLMGVSLFMVWQTNTNKKLKVEALKIFYLQLGLNALWSILFFGFRSPTFALIEIIILWISILFTITKFYKIRKNASYLLVPYLLWVSFATFLNLSIVLLN